MKYVAIDIETTGLNPKKCQIIEFGAVVDDLRVQAPLDQLPKFQTYIRHSFYSGDAYALHLNADIFYKISRGEGDIANPEELFGMFYNFLTKEGGYETNKPPKINVAGKNFGSFDKNFLDCLPNRDWVKFHHRSIDPGNLYFDPIIDDELPSLGKCLDRAGLPSEVSHKALEDALQVVKLVRKKYPLK